MKTLNSMQKQALHLQWTLEVILSGSDFIDVYLKNKNAPRKKQNKTVSIEIRSVTFFVINLIFQNNYYSLNLGTHMKTDRKALSWFKDMM